MADHTTTHTPHQHTNPWPFMAAMGLLSAAFGFLPLLYNVPVGWMLVIIGLGAFGIAVAAWLGTLTKEQKLVADGVKVEEYKNVGVWMVAFLILSEIFLFGSFFAAYFYLHAKDFALTQNFFHFYQYAEPGTTEAKIMDVTRGPVMIMNTILLVSSSFVVHFAEEQLKHGKLPMFRWLMGLTILLGLGFVGGQVYEYTNFILREGFSLFSGPYGTLFFCITGLHGLHVTAGVLILSYVLGGSFFGQVSPKKHQALTVISIYWHFVDVIWLFLVAVLYLRLI